MGEQLFDNLLVILTNALPIVTWHTNRSDQCLFENSYLWHHVENSGCYKHAVTHSGDNLQIDLQTSCSRLEIMKLSTILQQSTSLCHVVKLSTLLTNFCRIYLTFIKTSGSGQSFSRAIPDKRNGWLKTMSQIQKRLPEQEYACKSIDFIPLNDDEAVQYPLV
ncbi:hypothetical protein TNCT_726601 [Trichonephila clavata]|uniref:Uncharacterized protein n=1 Tax=Trichonephila clavata TaxID=2740835 RepID=A0A8X6JVQ0_TRICU|nr:hypothetical protein TNCT_726601 [Trichonephila clavata]